MTTVQMFAFNTSIASELKSRLAAVDEEGHSIVFEVPSKFQPSSHQLAIFNWVAKGTGSLIVRARAGSGKTTTILMSLRHIPGIHARDVSAKTFHAVGLGAILKRLGLPGDQVKADGGKVRRIAKKNLIEADYEMYGDFSVKLVALAKGAGIGPLYPDEMAAWYDLISHHDLFLDDAEATEERGIEIARKLLARSNEYALAGDIDFDDMLYLPLLWRLRLWQNDWVIVDEAQDTSPVRRAIAKLALRPGGRLIAVGDDKQAIYGFTGASHDAMDLIKREFRCVELPLTVSYRCPKSVALKVGPLVPDFSVPEHAIQGEDVQMTLNEAMRVLGPSDAILCRQTAPLVGLAFALIARGTGCCVLGKEIGSGLVGLIKRQKAKGVENLVEKLEAFGAREIAKHVVRGEEGKAEAVSDRIACIKTVIDSLSENGRTVPALISKIEGLFSDSSGVLSLATIHKVKGREYRRVAILRPDLMPSKWARQEHQYQQELNLQYVAWTRVLEMLIELTTDKFIEEKKPEAVRHKHVWVTDKSGLIDTCACGEERG